jgi:hypothetical protein
MLASRVTRPTLSGSGLRAFSRSELGAAVRAAKPFCTAFNRLGQLLARLREGQERLPDRAHANTGCHRAKDAGLLLKTAHTIHERCPVPTKNAGYGCRYRPRRAVRQRTGPSLLVAPGMLPVRPRAEVFGSRADHSGCAASGRNGNHSPPSSRAPGIRNVERLVKQPAEPRSHVKAGPKAGT